MISGEAKRSTRLASRYSLARKDLRIKKCSIVILKFNMTTSMAAKCFSSVEI